MSTTTTEHRVAVTHNPGARYPWLPSCTCGHMFWGYMSKEAAQNVADAHAATDDH